MVACGRVAKWFEAKQIGMGLYLVPKKCKMLMKLDENMVLGAGTNLVRTEVALCRRCFWIFQTMAGHGTAARSRGKERHVGVPCGVRNSRIENFEVVFNLVFTLWNGFNLHLGMFRPTSQGFVLRVRPKVHQEHGVAVSLTSVILSIGQFLKLHGSQGQTQRCLLLPSMPMQIG